MAEFELTPEKIDTAIAWRDQGFLAEQAAELCIAADWNPIETIKVLKIYFDVNLGEGKTMVDRVLDPAIREAKTYLRYQAELVLHFPEEATESDVERMESITGWNKKLWALVQSGRYHDIEGAIDRFDPNTMGFQTIHVETAKDMVLEVISNWETEMELLDELTIGYDFGWMFGTQSAKFVRTGDVLDMAVGHGPFLVDKFTGAVWETGSGLPVDKAVANYQATGNPTGRQSRHP